MVRVWMSVEDPCHRQAFLSDIGKHRISVGGSSRAGLRVEIEHWIDDGADQRDTGIPRGLPYLAGYVCHAAHQADSELPRMRMMPADLGMAAATHDDAECARLKALEDA
jgi:hypothetical protein